MAHMHYMRVLHACVSVALMGVHTRRQIHMLWAQGVVNTVLFPMSGEGCTYRGWPLCQFSTVIK